ncbi:hypothetical protein [Paraflavisolibacter sp. H34]|uniref:hypothetical protein n=1 Tax=Huijunlia imazamoxiresistens TaxID=3127457 RepID=UPI003018BC32
MDKLTRSIENVVTGDRFITEVTHLLKTDLKQLTKRGGWLFNWQAELISSEREVYKLTIQGNPMVIQGLISISVEPDHIYMHLIESAPFNKGKGKVYLGVPGNLVAYACRLSFQKGLDGFVAFHSKTKLIEHYTETLGAYHFGGHLMIIDTLPAKALIDKYFKE